MKKTTAQKVEPDPFKSTMPQVEEKYPNKIRGLAKRIPVSVCTG